MKTINTLYTNWTPACTYYYADELHTERVAKLEYDNGEYILYVWDVRSPEGKEYWSRHRVMKNPEAAGYYVLAEAMEGEFPYGLNEEEPEDPFKDILREYGAE